MAKTATASETAETREDVAETPLLDMVAAAIKKMVARGKERIDKRRDLAERDAKRQVERALKTRRA